MARCVTADSKGLHNMNKILITGHSGMLGRNIVNTLKGHPDRFSLFGVSKSNRLGSPGIQEFHGDLADERTISQVLSSVRPDVIIHTAALTNLTYCEQHKQETHAVHVALSQKLAQWTDARFIYISTDSVFSGEPGMCFSETDATYPLNYYAHSKLEGERTAQLANPDTLIVRTNIFGFKVPYGSSLAEWALKALRSGQPITGYTDVYFNPLYVGQVANLLLRLLDTKLKGILHIGSSESMSKFTFLRDLARSFEFSEQLICEALAPKDDVLRRPKNTCLNIGKLRNVLNENPSVSFGLEMFKSDYLKAV